MFLKQLKKIVEKILSLTVKDLILGFVVFSVLILIIRNLLLDNSIGHRIISYFNRNYYLHKGFNITELVAGLTIIGLIFYFIIHYLKDKIKSAGGTRIFFKESLSWIAMIAAIIFATIEWGAWGFICSQVGVPLLYFGLIRIYDYFKKFLNL